MAAIDSMVQQEDDHNIRIQKDISNEVYERLMGG